VVALLAEPVEDPGLVLLRSRPRSEKLQARRRRRSELSDLLLRVASPADADTFRSQAVDEIDLVPALERGLRCAQIVATCSGVSIQCQTSRVATPTSTRSVRFARLPSRPR
jgi:hypothetical protein